VLTKKLLKRTKKLAISKQLRNNYKANLKKVWQRLSCTIPSNYTPGHSAVHSTC